jgi:hypothetical protein
MIVKQMFILKINDEILNMIYDEKNMFIHNYQFKLDLKKSRYIETNNPDKSLFINNTKKKIYWV